MSISRDPIIKLQNWHDQEVLIDFLGGRVVRGVLKGFDHLNNLVLDKTVELLRTKEDSYKLSGDERELGLLVVRGSMVKSY